MGWPSDARTTTVLVLFVVSNLLIPYRSILWHDDYVSDAVRADETRHLDCHLSTAREIFWVVVPDVGRWYFPLGFTGAARFHRGDFKVHCCTNLTRQLCQILIHTIYPHWNVPVRSATLMSFASLCSWHRWLEPVRHR